MPEYGRNVQSMVEYVMTIEDRQKRLKNAEAIIELMGTLNPHLKTIEDYKHKLWDHLYQMTDFKLDVDSPYPPPTREVIFKKPEMIPYPNENKRNKHLGKNFNSLFEKAIAEPDDERRQGFTQTLGYYMKLAYSNWHKEPIHDDMIKNELAEMSNGLLRYESNGYRVNFDNRNGGYRPNRNGGNKPNNRNFKGGNNNNNKNNRNNNNFNKNKFKNKNK